MTTETDLQESTLTPDQIHVRENAAYYLNQWFPLIADLRALKEKEMTLRKRIFESIFPDPVEGSKNKFPLDDGYVVSGKHVVTRKVDDAALTSSKEGLREAGINLDELIKYKPEVVMSKYNQLTDEQRKIFDQILTVTPGSPSMEITKPKRG